MSLNRVASLSLLLAGLSQPAGASIGDVFGLGSRAAGVAGAAVALVDGFEATYYNPARLGGPARFAAGFLAARSFLDANGRRQSLEDPVGMVFGASAPIPLGGVLRDRFHVGIGLFLLPDKIVREIGRRPSEAFFPYFDNRTQRVVILPALSVRLHPKVSVGFGANVLAALGGTVSVREGPLRALDATVDEQLLTIFAFNFGISVEPVPWLTLGMSFRDQFSLPFFTNSRTSLSTSSFALDLQASTLFEPATFTLGLAARTGRRLTLSADLQLKRWSSYRGSFVEVSGTLPVPLGSIPEISFAPPAPAPRFRDIVAVRLGAEWRTLVRGPWSLTLRGGYGFEQSPLAEQPGLTNLVDGEKHILALGLGLARRGWFSVDVHLNLQVVGGTRLERAGGVVLEGGGVVLSGGLVGSYTFQ